MSAKKLPSVSKKRVQAELVKSETVQIRVSPNDKAAMKKAAGLCRLSVSEYLIRCHKLVSERL